MRRTNTELKHVYGKTNLMSKKKTKNSILEQREEGDKKNSLSFNFVLKNSFVVFVSSSSSTKALSIANRVDSFLPRSMM